MSSRASKKADSSASTPVSQEEAAGAVQLLQTQQALASMLLQASAFAFAQCTSTSTGASLSSKERRCVAQSVAGFINARAAIGQALTSHQTAEGRDF